MYRTLSVSGKYRIQISRKVSYLNTILKVSVHLYRIFLICIDDTDTFRTDIDLHKARILDVRNGKSKNFEKNHAMNNKIKPIPNSTWVSHNIIVVKTK